MYADLNQFVNDICQIQRCLPELTKDMILTFKREQGVSIATVRAWAAQGLLAVEGDRITQHPSQPDGAIALLKTLELQRPRSKRSKPRGFGG
jgi:hypothetical protein